jgi:hypothetical protein
MIELGTDTDQKIRSSSGRYRIELSARQRFW